MTKKTINQKILRYAKKVKSVNYKGGCCKLCKEDNIFKLTFHHINMSEKEFEYSDYNNYRWSLLKKELDKCELLCQNCHREVHYEFNKTEDRRDDKKIYLEHAGGECVKCGYNKCPSALTFHHRNPKEKEFWIGGLNERINSIYELSEKVKNEINKCDLLCANCHVIEHVDIDFYNRNIDLIINKSKNIKEIQSKIDREEVYKMLDFGMKQKDIAAFFNASNGTISDIKKSRKLIG